MKQHRLPRSIARRDSRELTRETAEFDRELVADSFRAPSPTQRRSWERSRRKPGRPRVGKGVKVISVSIERDLLDLADRLARKKKISRASLISRGIQAVLAVEGL